MPKALIPFTVHVIKKFIPIAVATSGICLLSYGLVHQEIRQNANDPQIQIASDVVSFLNNKNPFPNSQVLDPTKSLAPFIVIYDKNGTVTSSTAIVNGKPPVAPKSVLDAATSKGENRVTWQPQKDLRIAAVVKPYDAGYVLVGRNMKEIEARADHMLEFMLVCYAATLVGTLASIIVLDLIFPPTKLSSSIEPKSKK